MFVEKVRDDMYADDLVIEGKSINEVKTKTRLHQHNAARAGLSYISGIPTKQH